MCSVSSRRSVAIMRPINSLLHSASLGMFGMAAWLFAEATLSPPSSADQEAASRLGYETAERVIQDGKGPDRAVTPINPGWWDQFKEVNITGAFPPEPVSRTRTFLRESLRNPWTTSS